MLLAWIAHRSSFEAAHDILKALTSLHIWRRLKRDSNVQTRQSLRCSPWIAVPLLPWREERNKDTLLSLLPPFSQKLALVPLYPWNKCPFFPLFPKTHGRALDFSAYHTFLELWRYRHSLYFFLPLAPFWSNYYLYLHLSGFFQQTHNRGDIRHKTNFWFLGNGGRSPITSEEQRQYWVTG